MLSEIHPGEILLEDFMKPLAISARKLSSDIDVPERLIEELLAAKSAVTADMAAKLGQYFKMDPQFWINLQNEYDRRKSL